MPELILKTGKLPPKVDPRTLRLATYQTAALPSPPPSADWLAKLPADVGVMLNNQLGCCTCSAVGHFIQVWTSQTWPHPITISDMSVRTLYSAVSSYRWWAPWADHGAAEITVLNYWRANPIGTHKLAAYMAVEYKNPDAIKQTISLFGGAYVGLQMPLAAEDQTRAGRVWDIVAGSRGVPGSWSGHAVGIHAYDDKGLTCLTWGKRQTMTWAFFNACCDEAYALLSPDWVTQQWQTAAGMKWADLMADLALLK